MSEKLRQIQHEIATLRKDLEKLKRLKLDSEQTKKLRKKLVLIGCDQIIGARIVDQKDVIELRKRGFLVIVPSIILMFLSLVFLGASEMELKIFGFIWLTIGVTLHMLKWEWIVKEASKETYARGTNDTLQTKGEYGEIGTSQEIGSLQFTFSLQSRSCEASEGVTFSSLSIVAEFYVT